MQYQVDRIIHTYGDPEQIYVYHFSCLWFHITSLQSKRRYVSRIGSYLALLSGDFNDKTQTISFNEKNSLRISNTETTGRLYFCESAAIEEQVFAHATYLFLTNKSIGEISYFIKHYLTNLHLLSTNEYLISPLCLITDESDISVKIKLPNQNMLIIQNAMDGLTLKDLILKYVSRFADETNMFLRSLLNCEYACQFEVDKTSGLLLKYPTLHELNCILPKLPNVICKYMNIQARIKISF